MRALTAWRSDGLAPYRWGAPGRGGMSPAQQAFHQDRARLRHIRAANQVGKSRAGAAEAWWHATGTHPWRHVERHEGLGWICVATWGRPYQQVVRNLMATCPRDLVDWGKTQHIEGDDRFVNHQIVMKDGATIRFIPTGGGSTNAAAGTVDWLWIDEPPARAKWGELIKRPSRWSGPIWLTFTPWDSTQDLSWLRLELEGDLQRGAPPAAPWSLHQMPFQPLHVPWMTPEAVRAERALVPAVESPIRNDGEWEGATKARIFTAYQDPLDRLPEAEGEGAPWSIVVGSDWGELAGRTTAAITAQRLSGSRWPEVRALTEVVSDQVITTAEHAAACQRALAALGLRIRDVRRWVGDTNTLGIASPGARVNALFARELQALAQADRRKGEPMPTVEVEGADKRAGAPRAGWHLLGEALGRGLLRVDASRCPQLDRALRRWEGAEDEHRHILDGLRYATYDHLVEHLQPLLSAGATQRMY